MVRFIKVVNTIDKVTDCIPIVSTVKNVGILLYQLIHKVNKVANPVNTSWTDDVKIHALSKCDFAAGISSIPVIGNLACLIQYVREAIAKSKGYFILGGPVGYLGESSRRWYYGTKKHSYEITALYLARNPNRSEEKQAKSLRFAAGCENEEAFKLILDSREWSTQALKDVLKYVHSKKNAELLLDKCNDALTNEDIGDILSSHCYMYKESSYPIVELLTQKYPNMNINSVGEAIVSLGEYKDTFKPMAFLLKNFPDVNKDDRKKALLKASNKNNKEIIELIEQHTPGILEKNLDQVLKIAAQNHDISILNWLSETYKEKITPEQIGMVLAEQARSIYFGEDDNSLLIIKEILSTYPNLPPEVLVPFMKNAATHNSKLFEFYLNAFSQLEPEHLQDILNRAAYVYGLQDDSSWFAKRWKQVAELIQNKFPQMQAVNPYNF